jgi:hypothetical protein
MGEGGCCRALIPLTFLFIHSIAGLHASEQEKIKVLWNCLFVLRHKFQQAVEACTSGRVCDRQS